MINKKSAANTMLTFTAAAAMVFLMCISSACSPSSNTNEATPENNPCSANTKTFTTVHDDEGILDPAAWAEQFPNQYDSWVEAGKAEYSVFDPEMRYEAHGKINTFLSMYNMMGNNTTTGCIGCHTSAFPAFVHQYGDSLIDVVDDDLFSILREAEDKTVGIGCYSCHGNLPGTAVVTKTWIVEAAEKGGVETSDDNLICAQCHSTPDWNQINTNSDPSSWSMLQYGLEAESYWEIYKDCPEELFLTVLNALPGESEFNQYIGSTMDMAGAVCADCHMENKTDENGSPYTDHAFQSVATNEKLYDNCLTCHTGTVDEIKTSLLSLQSDYMANHDHAKTTINSLRDAIDLAKSSGMVSLETINEAETIYKKAQFFLTYGTDNGSGIHVMGMSAAGECLSIADTIAAEGLAMLL